MSDPWMKFYPTDWRSDPALRMCSMAARGLWIEMIALMHEAVPYGHLLVSGRSPTDTQLAVLAGAPPEQISEMIGELESAGVFSRTKEGVIYSRKMTRTAKKAAIARKNGKNGGNPSLSKQSRNPPSDNHQDKGGVKPQKPEARDKSIPEANASGRDASPAEPDEDFSKQLFDRAVAFLGRHGVLERHARGIVGKWRRDHTDAAILDAFTACSRAGAIDPIPWITARLGAAERASASVIPLDRVAAAALANLQAEAERKAASR